MGQSIKATSHSYSALINLIAFITSGCSVGTTLEPPPHPEEKKKKKSGRRMYKKWIVEDMDWRSGVERCTRDVG